MQQCPMFSPFSCKDEIYVEYFFGQNLILCQLKNELSKKKTILTVRNKLLDMPLMSHKRGL